MQDRQKIKQACIIPLDIWEEEINRFVRNISAKLNIAEAELLAWIHEHGKQYFNEAQEHCYLELLQYHQFPQITMGYIEGQIRDGFNSLYEIFLKTFLKSNNKTDILNNSTFSRHSAMSILMDDEDKIAKPTDADFAVLIKECLSQHRAIIALNTAYLCDFHDFLRSHPSLIVSDEFINQFKLDCIKKLEADISQQVVVINKLQENTAGQQPVLIADLK